MSMMSRNGAIASVIVVGAALYTNYEYIIHFTEAFHYAKFIKSGGLISMQEAFELGKATVTDAEKEGAKKHGRRKELKKAVLEGKESITKKEYELEREEGKLKKLQEIREEGAGSVTEVELRQALEEGREEALKEAREEGKYSISEEEYCLAVVQSKKGQLEKYVEKDDHLAFNDTRMCFNYAINQTLLEKWQYLALRELIKRNISIFSDYENESEEEVVDLDDIDNQQMGYDSQDNDLLGRVGYTSNNNDDDTYGND